MKPENSQEEDILTPETEIDYVFCKPYNEDYYIYSINSIDSEHMISRQSLNEFIFKLSNSYFRTQYLTSHFRNFIYNKITNEFIELQEDEFQDSIKNYIKQNLNDTLYSNNKKENRLAGIINKIKKTLL